MEYEQYVPIIKAIKESKGIWIPVEIENIKNISWSEKILLTRILWLNQKEGCFANNEYLAKEMMISVRQIQRMLLNLKSRKLIRYKYINKNRHIKLRSDISVMGGVTDVSWGGDRCVVLGVTDPSPRGDINVTHNNIINNTVNNKDIKKEKKIIKEKKKDFLSKKIFAASSKEINISNYLLNKLLAIKPDIHMPNLQTWAKEADRMFRIDKRRFEEIRQVIDWIFEGTDNNSKFWRSNILSIPKLRKKYDTLSLQMKQISSKMANWDEYLALKKSGKF